MPQLFKRRGASVATPPMGPPHRCVPYGTTAIPVSPVQFQVLGQPPWSVTVPGAAFPCDAAGACFHREDPKAWGARRGDSSLSTLAVSKTWADAEHPRRSGRSGYTRPRRSMVGAWPRGLILAGYLLTHVSPTPPPSSQFLLHGVTVLGPLFGTAR